MASSKAWRSGRNWRHSGAVMCGGAQHDVVGSQRVGRSQKPRLRLTMRRSSSGQAVGVLPQAMSRVMFTSAASSGFGAGEMALFPGHLYSGGDPAGSPSGLPRALMMRLSAAFTPCGCWWTHQASALVAEEPKIVVVELSIFIP